jgi:hypothetical protein
MDDVYGNTTANLSSSLAQGSCTENSTEPPSSVTGRRSWRCAYGGTKSGASLSTFLPSASNAFTSTVTLHAPRFTAPMFVRNCRRALLSMPCAMAVMSSVSTSNSPVQTPGMVWPYVPSAASLYVLLVTRNERATIEFSTPGLSSGNVARSSAPLPPRLKTSRMTSSEMNVEFGGIVISFSGPVAPPVGRSVMLTFSE